MKITLLVLLHAFCAFAGFWIATPRQHPAPSTADVTIKKTKTAPASASPIITKPAPSSEVGAALLTPQNWPIVIDPISRMSLSELPAMLRGTLRNPFPDVRTRLMRYLFERWATLDLPGALTALRGISSPQLKQRALWAVLDSWHQTDPAAAWKWLSELDDDSVLQEAGIEYQIGLSAEKDPLGSAAYAAQIEDAFLREKALISIGSSWVNEDPKGAFAALTTVEPQCLRDYLLNRLCYADGIDHVAGLEIVSQLHSRAQRAELTGDWIHGYAMAKPQEAFHWLRDHADRPELQRAAAMLGGQFGENVKTSAEIREMAQQLPAGPIRDAFASRAAEEWAESGHSLDEAQQILALCGPSLERDSAQNAIDSKRSRP